MKSDKFALLCDARMHSAMRRRLRAQRVDCILESVPAAVDLCAFVSSWQRTRAGKRTGTIINLCSIASSASEQLAAKLSRGGSVYLDAPLSGTIRDAARGALTAIVSGPKSAFARVTPALDAIASRVFYVGRRPGAAQVMHQINGSLASTLLALACEVYVTGTKAGLAQETMTQIFSNGSGRTAASSRIIPEQAATRRFRHGKRIADACRELTLMNAEADRRGITMWVGGKTKQIYTLASQLGSPRDDITRLITHYEKWTKVEVKAAGKRRR